MIRFSFGNKKLTLKYVRVTTINRSNKNIIHSVNKPPKKSYGEVIQRWSTNSPRVRISGTIVNSKFDPSLGKAAIGVGKEALSQVKLLGDDPKQLYNNLVRDVELLEYPREEVDLFLQMLEYEGSIGVSHPILNEQSIDKLVVDNAQLPETEGEVYQDFTVNFIADSYDAPDLLVVDSEPTGITHATSVTPSPSVGLSRFSTPRPRPISPFVSKLPSVTPSPRAGLSRFSNRPRPVSSNLLTPPPLPTPTVAVPAPRRDFILAMDAVIDMMNIVNRDLERIKNKPQ